jgi:signal transduction histidine kinase/ActR/RegA family two-component response regulator
VTYRTVDRASGALKWVRALGGAAYSSDGTPSRFDGVTVDVTSQKLTEERLARALEREREQARLLRHVADAALTIHSAGSLDSVLRVITEEARHVLGAQMAVSSLTVGEDCAQAISTLAASANYQHWPKDRIPPIVEGVCAEVCRTNRPLRLTRAELESHPAWRGWGSEVESDPPQRCWAAAPLVSRGGKNLGLIQLADKDAGVFSESDEAALVQLAHIASVAIENARLYDELREHDRRKDEFLALLAHELRNPLAPVRNGLQVMRLAGRDVAAVEVARDMMDRQLSHMVRIVDDLLDVSRITRNKLELRRSRVLLADAVGSAVEIARPAIDAAGHELTVLLPPTPVYLHADLTRLTQVFGNLLSNSAKYTEPGGRIWLTADREGDHVAVTVRDTGIGIPGGDLRTIFDMFSQVDRGLERSTGGLGIGLALVKGLVEMHGGTVEAASTGPGQGSTFAIRLPALPEAADRGQEPTAGQGRRAAEPRRRVLAVDDSRDSATSMAMMLELIGYDVRTANDGAEAVRTAEQFRPDVILMDVGMPRLNGYEATRRIREQPWGTSSVIIALTGWGQETDRAKSREAGCDGHLVKPVNLPDLEKLFADLLPANGGR